MCTAESSWVGSASRKQEFGRDKGNQSFGKRLTEGERGSVVRLIRRFFTHSDSPYGPRTCRKRTGEPDSTTPMPKSTGMCHARVLMKNRFSAGWPRAKCTSQLWIGAANPPLPRGYGYLRFATDTAVPRPAIMGQPGKNLRIKHEMSRFRILAKKSFGIPNRNPRRWRRSNVICRSCERPSGARDGKMVGQATRKSGL